VKVVVCRSRELAPGASRSVAAGGGRVLVHRAEDGVLHAVNDRCPHNGARLSGGRIERLITSDAIGEYVLTARWIVRCPWHRYEFELENGRCPVDPRKRVRVYRVADEDGMVVLER
jgi:nitrite reductase/ring-hydroxylating ferredoxin subunit